MTWNWCLLVLQNMCRRHFLLSDHFLSLGGTLEAHATPIDHHRHCVRSILTTSFPRSLIFTSGLMGQYPLAALVGKILDYYGAWACSLISACLFLVGFGLSANEISRVPDTISQPSTSTFHNLVILFFIAGLGAVFSYVYLPPHSACINTGLS